MNTTVYDGVHTALITPFKESGTIDFHSLETLVNTQIAQGIAGLVPVGTTGESPTLSHKEHIEVIQTVCKVVEASEHTPLVIAGTGSNNTYEAIELTKAAQDLGCSASLQVIPYYNKPSQEGLYRHFVEIAEQSTIPLILYNIPGRSGVALSVDTIIRLAAHPRIVAIKEATGAITTAIALRCLIPDFVVLSGDDLLSLSMLVHGARGLISVVSNILPVPIIHMVSEALHNNYTTAQQLYKQLYEAFTVLFLETNPIPVKYAASQLGLCTPHYRLPLCAPSVTTKKKIDELLENLAKSLQKKL